MSKATDDVLAERQRQIDAEGWTEEHDDQHTDRSMALLDFAQQLIAAQKPIPTDIAKILNDNLWDLYDRETT